MLGHPQYYGSPADFLNVMRFAIAINGSFNTHRLIQQYLLKAYF